MIRASLISVLAVSIGLTACATQPRSYVPSTLANGTTSDAYRADFARCAELARAEADRRKGRVAQVAVGGAGAGAGAAVGVSAASASVAASGLSGAAAGAGAVTTIVLLPIALGAAAGVGIASASIRRKKEKALKASMQSCMLEQGHTVEGWKRG